MKSALQTISTTSSSTKSVVERPADSTIDRLEVRIERDFCAMEHRREEWDKAVVELGGNIYSCFDWCRTWWEFYGRNKELRIFLCSVGDQLVGIVPVYIDRIGFKPLQLAIARLVCANIPPKAFHPPVHPDWAEAIFGRVVTQLLEQDRCDVISLGPIGAGGKDGFLASFERAARGRGTRAVVERTGVHTVFHLPKTLDQFFDGLDKDERKKRKYEMRLLGKEPGITREVVSAPAALEDEFDRFADLHASQWSGKGKLGHFGSWPDGRLYNRALVRSLGKLGRVRFVHILSGEEVISTQFAFAFGDTWHWELPARVMDRKWNRFSLGTTGFFHLVEEALKEGAAHIEAGIAHYDYKQKLNGTEHGLDVLRVVADRASSRLLSAACQYLRQCVQLIYYKIWYGRISPRLPAAFRKPIWRFWLRLDF